MSVSFDCLPILFQGLYLTFYLSMVSVVGGITLGVIGGLCRQSETFFFSGISRIYVVIFRGTPFLVQLYIIYFVLPSFGIKLTSIQAGIIALSFNSGAYITEIVRAGLMSKPAGTAVNQNRDLPLMSDAECFSYFFVVDFVNFSSF